MPTLHWIGKDKVINHHMQVPFRVLEHTFGFSNGVQENRYTHSGNKIIHGDNLEALKALLPEYEGKINCIYIDPPYNTGNESWVYNDNVNDPRIKKWLGQVVGKESEDLSRHDKWLCMIYPRLKLLQKLMSKDGALVISIGYQEVFNLMQVCKELFSSKQVVCVTVQTSGGKPAAGFNYQHEYLIFVVPENFTPNPLSFSGGKTRSPFEGLTLSTFIKAERPNQTYPIFINVETGDLAGTGKSLHDRIKDGSYTGDPADFHYDFSEAPEGTVAIWPITSKGKDCVWRLKATRLQSDWKKGYIKITPNRSRGNINTYSIQYLPEGVIKKIENGSLAVSGQEPNMPTLTFGENKTVGSEIPTLWLEKSFYSVKGTTLLNSIFGKKIFNYPKPVDLMMEIIGAISAPDDIILDSFGGSASTAHAVMNLNIQDGGKRKFILIEMEEYAQTVTAERVKHVINGFGETDGIPTEFDFYTLGENMFTTEGYLNESIGLRKIKEYIYYTETREYLPADANEHEYLLGKHIDTSYYLHYLPDQSTSLNREFLKKMQIISEQYVVYADNCLLTAEFMKRHSIIFKKIPRDITRF